MILDWSTVETTAAPDVTWFQLDHSFSMRLCLITLAISLICVIDDVTSSRGGHHGGHHGGHFGGHYSGHGGYRRYPPGFTRKSDFYFSAYSLTILSNPL